MTFENRIDLDILHMYNQNYDEGLDVFMFVNQMTYGERDDDGEEGAKIPAGWSRLTGISDWKERMENEKNKKSKMDRNASCVWNDFIPVPHVRHSW